MRPAQFRPPIPKVPARLPTSVQAPPIQAPPIQAPVIRSTMARPPSAGAALAKRLGESVGRSATRTGQRALVGSVQPWRRFRRRLSPGGQRPKTQVGRWVNALAGLKPGQRFGGRPVRDLFSLLTLRGVPGSKWANRAGAGYLGYQLGKPVVQGAQAAYNAPNQWAEQIGEPLNYSPEEKQQLAGELRGRALGTIGHFATPSFLRPEEPRAQQAERELLYNLLKQEAGYALAHPGEKNWLESTVGSALGKRNPIAYAGSWMPAATREALGREEAPEYRRLLTNFALQAGDDLKSTFIGQQLGGMMRENRNRGDVPMYEQRAVQTAKAVPPTVAAAMLARRLAASKQPD